MPSFFLIFSLLHNSIVRGDNLPRSATGFHGNFINTDIAHHIAGYSVHAAIYKTFVSPGDLSIYTGQDALLLGVETS